LPPDHCAIQEQRGSREHQHEADDDGLVLHVGGEELEQQEPFHAWWWSHADDRVLEVALGSSSFQSAGFPTSVTLPLASAAVTA